MIMFSGINQPFVRFLIENLKKVRTTYTLTLYSLHLTFWEIQIGFYYKTTNQNYKKISIIIAPHPSRSGMTQTNAEEKLNFVWKSAKKIIDL